jgi:DNA (cytosine-5)-methyltransferase 1
MNIDREKIKEIMSKKGIDTQTELATMMGITKNQLSVILSEKFMPVKSNVEKLAKVLDVGVDTILTNKRQCDCQADMTPIDDHYDPYRLGKIKKNGYHCVELFAGAGGLALGLEKAGFSEDALVELDKDACATLRQNRPNWNVIEGDIIQIAQKGLTHYLKDKNIEIDLLSGGYPCQSFSYAGMRKGLEDARGTLFYYYAMILKELQPKVFLAENVRGLVNHDGGKTLATMISVFESIGYRVYKQLLNAKNYGVAQKRERIVMIGVRNDIKKDFKFPEQHEYKPVLRDALKDVPKSQGEKYTTKKFKVMELVPPGGCWRDLPDDVARDYMKKSYFLGGGRTGMARRISWDEPSLTVTCSPSQKQTERCHPDETRPFTTREYARIQSFPDSWAFAGNTGSIYKQIGNAVPVELAHAIGDSITDFLNKVTGKS